MRRFTTYLTLFFGTILILSLRIPTKDLTEYKKWLEFHKIKDSDFEKYGNDVERKMKWIEYDLTEDYKEIFRPFRLYSSDSTYFIDLDSYSLVLEKENGRLISYGSEVDRKVQVIRNSDNQAATLLFCGTNCYPETANWISDKILQILGFSLDDNNNFIPTKWTVDLNNMLFSQYRTDKKFKKMPPSYMEIERLKMIEFKE